MPLATAVVGSLPVSLDADGALVAWGIPLLWTQQRGGPPRDAQRLHLEARSGKLIRIRPGVFAPPGPWNEAHPLERHLATAVALALASRVTPVFCRETALALHGIPLAAVPREVSLRASTPGAAGRTARPKPAHSQRNGYPERRIRRPGHWPTVRTSDVGNPAEDKPMVHTLYPGVALAVEDLRYCLADTVHRMHYLESTVVLDALKGGRLNGALGKSKRRQEPWTDSDFSSLFALTGSVAASERLRWALDFSSGAAESPQESMSRVRIHQLGFEKPALQHTIVDQDGLSLGEGDFWWEGVRVLGECDGKAKYAGAQSYSGRQASEVVYAEKRREDRIREQGITVVRWGYDEVMNPRTLEQKLLRAGVPRTRH